MTALAPRLYAVVPAFNEGSVLQEVITHLRQVCPQVVVVDDGSSDDTADAARRGGALVVRHAINLGQGAALQTGIDCALASGATHIITFDADGQHDPREIETLFAAMQAAGVDIALGSRFKGRTVSMPLRRRLLLQAARVVNFFFTGLWLSDAHNGLRLLNRHAASRIQLRQARMAHATEIISQVARNRSTYVEVPVTVTYTAYSQAKGQRMSNSIHIVLDLILRGLLK